MFGSICILGRQPNLSIAELESLFGGDKIKPISNYASLVDLQSNKVPFERLGGTIKLGKVLTEINSTDWQEITKFLLGYMPDFVAREQSGKIKFGISVYGLNANIKAINVTALEIKKAIKTKGRSMRVIPNKNKELNTAQVLHNKLTNELGIELLLIQHGTITILAQTTNVQDIDAYAARDQKRPKRDARVGMLPPKLAQIILNLSQAEKGDKLLDPFCGTGVLLQEALLMGCYIYGTDIEPRMIEYTRINLNWLIGPAELKLNVGDATNFKWSNFDVIACETYLGRPFSVEPRPDKLREVIQDVNTIHKKFLQNLAKQTKPEFRMCIAVPAWHTKTGVKHLPILDHLSDMGYTRESFVHAKTEKLIYHRDGQFVGRELVVLIRT
jgi:tRNA (guanine10-N2)-dimethyltransferase